MPLRSPLRRALASLAGLLAILLATSALAAVSVDAPRGWSARARGDALARAEGWTTALGGRLVSAYATRNADDFTETIAVIELDGPLPANAADALAAAAEDSLGPILGDAPLNTLRLAEFEDGNEATIIEGRFELEGVVHYFAVGDAGASRGVLLLAARSADASLYEGTFEDLLDETRGFATGVARFNTGLYWSLGVAAWLLIAIASWVLVRLRLGALAEPSEQGRGTALLCLVATPLVGVAAYVIFLGKEAELNLVGLSPSWAAARIGLLGLATIALVLIIGAIRASRVQPIQSAPSDGAFSGRPKVRAPSVPAAHRSTVVSGSVDGPSSLEAATPPPLFTPAADEPVAPESDAAPAPAPGSVDLAPPAQGETTKSAATPKKTLFGLAPPSAPERPLNEFEFPPPGDDRNRKS